MKMARLSWSFPSKCLVQMLALVSCVCFANLYTSVVFGVLNESVSFRCCFRLVPLFRLRKYTLHMHVGHCSSFAIHVLGSNVCADYSGMVAEYPANHSQNIAMNFSFAFHPIAI